MGRVGGDRARHRGLLAFGAFFASAAGLARRPGQPLRAHFALRAAFAGRAVLAVRPALTGGALRPLRALCTDLANFAVQSGRAILARRAGGAEVGRPQAGSSSRSCCCSAHIEA